jgi:hypothetical protein
VWILRRIVCASEARGKRSVFETERGRGECWWRPGTVAVRRVRRNGAAGQNGGRLCELGELWVYYLTRSMRYAEWREG